MSSVDSSGETSRTGARPHTPLRIYLSGGMEFARTGGADWRTGLELRLHTEFGWTCFNPVDESRRFLERLHPGVIMRELKAADPERFRSIVADIVRHDSAHVVERTDLVVCLWDEAAARGAGTQGELTLAFRHNIPVYLVTALPFTAIPGWVIGCATEILPSFDALCTALHAAYPASP